MVFASTRSGRRDIWAQRVQDGKATGSAEFISKEFVQKDPLGLTRDGSLFYSTNSEVAEVYTAELNAAGRLISGPTAISSRFVGANTMPDYSRDGRFLAYVSGMPTSVQSDIRIRTVTTGEERSIPKPVRNVNQLRWYPDGKSLLIFGGDGAGSGSGFYRLEIETGVRTKILDGIRSFAAVNPTFSPDGKYLYYEARPTPDVTVLMRMDVATGTKQEVLRHPAEELRIYSLSSDGSQIVYNWRKDAQDQLYLIPAAGGESKRIYELPKSEWRRAWGGLAWSADGRSVLYHGIPDTGRDELIRIPIDGSAPEPILTTGIIRRIAVHPDGRHITFEARTNSAEVSVMENLFPRTR
jgi:Tol biopolymer transport system component